MRKNTELYVLTLGTRWYVLTPVPSVLMTKLLHFVQPPPPLVTMRRWAIASAVIYAVGIPATFAYVLFKHRKDIQADQTLRVYGYGNSRAQNPNFAVRQRYQKLYRYFHWLYSCGRCTVSAIVK